MPQRVHQLETPYCVYGVVVYLEDTGKADKLQGLADEGLDAREPQVTPVPTLDAFPRR